MANRNLIVNLKYGLYRSFKKLANLAGKIVIPLCQRNERLMDIATKIYVKLNSSLSRSYLKDHIRSNDQSDRFLGEFGVNVLGYINSESGVGEAVRANIRAMEAIGMPFVLNNLISLSRQGDRTYTDIVDENPNIFNLIHVNADTIQNILIEKGLEYFRYRYNIGYWYWELSKFPEEWLDRFEYLNEVWVATEFCRSTVAKVSPIPVVKIPPPVAVDTFSEVDRADYGLEEGSFVFFFMFDYFSYFERKNPMALIRAFREAFGPGDDAVLLLKCTNSENNISARDRLMEAAKGLNVRFIDRYVDKDEIHALFSMCDCYVSLHRSEGFGLPMAEAMYLGKPVIATNYSGNTEFMNEQNSLPVDYTLVEIERDFGPYKKGNVWAEPDVGHAATLMRRAYDDREFAKSIGEAASHHIRENYSPEATGRRIKARLEQIAREKGLLDEAVA